MRKLIVSSSPHVHSPVSTRGIMRDVLIALSPACVMAIVYFRLSALIPLVVCVAGSVLAEFCYTKICKKPTTVGDLSAAVTGVLLGLNMAPGGWSEAANLGPKVFQCLVGSVVAIIVVKCFFGGLGHNFANPAVTARIVVFLAFTESMTGFVTPSLTATGWFADSDPATLVSGATPLGQMSTGAVEELPPLVDMLLGLRAGAIGEVCAIALLLGFAYLLVRRVITWHIPVIYVGTVFVLSWLVMGSPVLALYQVLSGGLLLGAIFMATDYVTTPLTKGGRMLFALGCGIITVLIRQYGAYPEGVSFAILLMNILSPYLEKWTSPRPKGGRRA